MKQRSIQRPAAASVGRFISAAVVTGALLLTSAGPARAAGKVALFPFEGFALPAGIEMAPVGFHEAVRTALERAGYEIVEPVLTLRDMAIAVGCDKFDRACVPPMAGYMEVEAVVVGKLTATPDDQVRIRLRFYEGAGGGIVREVDWVADALLAALELSFERAADELVGTAPGPEPAEGTGGERVTLFALAAESLPPTAETVPMALTDAIAAALVHAGATLVPSVLGYTDLSLALGCTGAVSECMVAIAEHLGATRVLRGEVRSRGAGLWVRISMYSAATGAMATVVERNLSAAPTDTEKAEIASEVTTATVPPVAAGDPMDSPPGGASGGMPPVGTVDLTPTGATTAPPPTAGSSPLSRVHPLSWTVAGVGVVALAASVATGLGTRKANLDYASMRDAASAKLDPNASLDMEGLHALAAVRRRGRALAASTDVLIGVGGAAVAVGAVLIALDLVRDGSKGGGDTAPAVHVGVGPGAASVLLTVPLR